LRIQAPGLRVQGLGFSVQDVKNIIHGLGFRGEGFINNVLGFRVECSGFRIQGLGLRV
jgi:hypothetical protein